MSDLIPRHGGYRKLKSFQVAQLVYDITVRFCDRYVDKFSRTKDQMVQVARASLEELKLDYEDFLRQRGLATLEPNHPALTRFKQHKPQTVEAFAAWVEEERRRSTDEQGRTQTVTDAPRSNSSMPVRESPCQSMTSAWLAANGALSLLNLACYFLDRQVERLALDFENEGGFTERLYKMRTAKRRNQP